MLISWNLTRRCNLDCGHCYLDAVRRRSDSSGELVTSEALRVIEQIADLAPGAMLILTGGEPLLRRDLEEIVMAAAQAGLMPVIGTNGCLLDEARAKSLKDKGAAGVGISLDSTAPDFHDRLRGQAGAWHGALAGMSAARAASLPLLMQTTLFAENRGHLSALEDLATKQGAMALNFFFLVCTGRGVTQSDLSPEAYEESLREILALQAGRVDKRSASTKIDLAGLPGSPPVVEGQERGGTLIRARCAPYARRMLGLHAGESAGGYADWSSACLAGRSYLRIGPQGDVTPCPYIPESSGNLRHQSLREIWEKAASFVRLRSETPGGKCGACDYRLSCGGCRARALASEGDLMAEDRKCAYRPPQGAVPETQPPIVAPEVRWDEEAGRLLSRIPGFLRDRVRSSLERKAIDAGEPVITVAFMQAHRPGAIPFVRPSLGR